MRKIPMNAKEIKAYRYPISKGAQIHILQRGTVANDVARLSIVTAFELFVSRNYPVKKRLYDSVLPVHPLPH